MPHAVDRSRDLNGPLAPAAGAPATEVRTTAIWRRRRLPFIGGVIGFAALGWIAAGLDYVQLRSVLDGADPAYIVVVPIVVVAEHLVRAWKWRQILHPLRSIGTLRLFGSIMAGYLAKLLVPLGLSPFVRSWLVARAEAVKMSTVLASVAIDRLIDGVVFAGLVFLSVLFAVFPDPDGEIRLGLVIGAAGSLGAITAALVLLWHHKRASAQGMGWVLRTARRPPRRYVVPARALALSFADGIVWPAEAWRRTAIVAASILIKLIAASHLFWAGLAFGVRLDPFAYLVLLAIRFFGGGLLALGVAGLAHRLLETMTFPDGHAAMLGLGAVLLLVSALSFVSSGEPEAPESARADGFGRFLREGVGVYHADRRFRVFVYVRWLEGAAAMALPFYVVQATAIGVDAAEVAILLGAQTAGALASNPLWGWWGDRVGKRQLLEVVAALSILAPALALTWLAVAGATPPLAWFGVVFFLLGAVGNGGTIAQLGYLMEISPDDRRPAYGGYFNAIVAPAALSPLAGAAFVEGIGLPAVLLASAIAGGFQFVSVRRLRRLESKEARA